MAGIIFSAVIANYNRSGDVCFSCEETLKENNMQKF